MNENQSIGLSRRRLLQAGALLPLGGATAWAQAQESDALAKIHARGSLIVAVYNTMPPFNLDGAGIDVKIAEQLALALGVKLSLMPFNARSGWAVGMAVKKDSTGLARELQAAVNDMSQDGRLTKIFAAQGVPWGAA